MWILFCTGWYSQRERTNDICILNIGLCGNILDFDPLFVEIQLEYVVRSLKTLVTIGNCQRLVFTLGVSQHMHKITNL